MKLWKRLFSRSWKGATESPRGRSGASGNRTVNTLTCDTRKALPSIEQIRAIPREHSLWVIFSPAIEEYRESTGAGWKEGLPGFNVGIHKIRPEINISKLISEAEIDAHATSLNSAPGITGHWQRS